LNVAKACGTDAELRLEVESLLVAHDSDAAFLESPVVAAADANAHDLAAQLIRYEATSSFKRWSPRHVRV